MGLEADTELQGTYIDVFLSPKGKVVLEHMFNQLGMGNTTMVANDPYSSAYNEGRRSVYMEILRIINVDFTPLMQASMRYKHRS